MASPTCTLAGDVRMKTSMSGSLTEVSHWSEWTLWSVHYTLLTIVTHVDHNATHYRSVATEHYHMCRIIPIGFGTRPFLNWTERDFPTLNTMLTKTDPTRIDMITINIYKREHNTGLAFPFHIDGSETVLFLGSILMD